MPYNVDIIRDLCRDRRTTIAEVERAIGIGNGVIARWEKGKKSPPFDTLCAIADFLDVPVSALLDDELSEKLGTKKAPSQMAEGQSAAKQALVQFILRMPDDQAEELLSELASRLSRRSAPGADPESR